MPLFGNSLLSTSNNAGTVATVPVYGTGLWHGLTSATQTSITTANSQDYINQIVAAQNAVTTSSTTATNTVYWYSTEQEQWMEHSQYLGLARQRAVVFRERTAEEQRLLVERQRIANEEHERRQAAHKIAVTRSLELLVLHLTKEQARTFEKNKWFVVEGGRSKQRYRIRDSSYSGNIDVLQGERVTHRLCCHCLDSAVPIYDHLLAQKLHLQYDEDRFLQIANRHAA